MSDFLEKVVQEEAPISREVTIGGETGIVYFRRISAGEREQLLRGIKVEHKAGMGSVEIELADNERQKQMLVMFSVCREDGSRFFKKIDDVKKLSAAKLEVLVRHAEEVNKADDWGKD